MRLFYWIIFILFFMTSCQRQSAPQLDKSFDEITDFRRVKACSEVSFIDDFLLKKNVENLFVCTKWDALFPNFFNAIRNIKETNWNHFFNPISKAFFENREKRDSFLSLFKNLDRDDALDDFSRVLTAFSETNFYDGLYALLLCTSDSDNELCHQRIKRVLSHKEVKEFFQFFRFKKDDYLNFAFSLKKIIEALGEDSSKWGEQIRKFYQHPDFKVARLALFDGFSEGVLRNFSDTDRYFFQRLLTTEVKGGKLLWLEQYLKEKISKDEFIYLIRYPYVKNVDLIDDLKVIESVINSNLFCSESDGSSVELRFSSYLDEFIISLSKNNQKTFFNRSIQTISALQMAAPFCPFIKEYEIEISVYPGVEHKTKKHKVNFLNIMEKISEFMVNSDYFDLIQFLSRLTIDGLEEEEKKPKYFLQFLTNDFYQAQIDLMKFIDQKSNDFYPLTYNILKKLSSDGYKSVGALLYSIFSKNNNTFKSLARGWLFFTPEEKNFLLNVIDRHFDKNTDYIRLFKFYADALVLASEDAESIGQSLFSHEHIEKSLIAFEDGANHFRGQDVLNDFKTFFSREHIVRIVQIISQGLELKNRASAQLESFLVDEYIKNANIPSISLDMSASEWLGTEEAQSCIQSISSDKHDIYNLLQSIPSKCQPFKKDAYGLLILDSLSGFNKAYQDLYSINESLFDRLGLFGKANLYSFVATLKSIDESYKGENEEGNKGFLSDLRDYFSTNREKKYAELVKFLYGVVSFLDGDQTTGEDYRNKLIQKFSNSNVFKQTGKFIGNFLSLAKDYKKWVFSEEWNSFQGRYRGKEEVKYNCREYQNSEIGGAPCPTKEQLKITGRFLLKDLKAKYEEDVPSAIKQLLKGLSSTGGLKIPYEGKNQRIKRLKISETFQMLYDLSNRSLPSGINKKKVEYFPNPKADLKYFTEEYPKYDKELLDEEPRKTKPSFSTLERIEGVLREVRFDTGYLGTHYMNSVARAVNYNDVVISKKKLLKKCVPFRFCGRFMNKLEYRMAKNAVNTFDGLLDPNIKESWKYGDSMMSLLTAIVSSSLKSSQFNNFTNIEGTETSVPRIQEKNELRKHNSRILIHSAMLGAFTNISRVLRDRIGRTSKEFHDFLNSKELTHFDSNFLRHVDFDELEPVIRSLLEQLNMPRIGGGSIADDIIDFINSLNYEETRIVEDTLLKTLTISTFLGPNSWHFSPRSFQGISSEEARSLKIRYSSIDQGDAFRIFEKILPYYSILKSVWPKRIRFIDFVRGANNIVNFFYRGLFSNYRANNTYFLTLNDLFKTLVSSFLDRDIIDLAERHLQASLSKREVVHNIYESFLSLKFFTDYLFFESRKGLDKIVSLVDILRQDKRLNFDSFRDYLGFTTKKEICINRNELHCRMNSHFDEPTRLIWLGIKDPDHYFTTALESMLFIHHSKLKGLLELTIPHVILK